MKKIISFVLSCTIIFSILPSPVMALSGSNGNINWTISGRTLMIDVPINVDTAEMPDWSTPPWYSERYTIESVSIRTGGVTSIGNNAFADFKYLKSIRIPNGITSIGNNAFSDCSSLTSITIPNSVTSIGTGAFVGCDALKDVYISDLESWCKIDFGSSSANPMCCADNLYLNKQLLPEEVTIPDSITSINGTFAGCSNLKSITIPDSVTSIGKYAFWGCSGLTSITIPDSVTSIGEYVFAGCSISSITIPDGVTSIGEGAFAGCPISNITIPDGVTSIGKNAFAGCSSLTSITIPDSVKSIGDSAFAGCPISSITIPDGVKRIGESTFKYCNNLTSITIPNSVTYIGTGAFWGCSGLTSITIPNSVIKIDKSAFLDCSGLTSITIPKSVISIGENAFTRCSGLKDVYISDLKAWCNIAFGNYATDYPFMDSDTCYANPMYYADNLYLNNQLLTEIAIPKGITNIGNCTFCGCNNLTSITIPDGVTSIGNAAFFDCEGLTSITIPDGVKSIGEYAFYDCRSSKSITIPDGVTRIGKGAFERCSSLVEITIPYSVASVGNRVFDNCENLSQVYYIGTEEQCNNLLLGKTCPKSGNAYYTYKSVIRWKSVGWGSKYYYPRYDEVPRKYTVTLNTNGGKIDKTITDYSYGSAVALPIPTKSGYIFGGWYDNEAYSGAAILEIPEKATGDKIYYAKWTKIYSITFVNYNNAKLQSGNVAVNTMPEYNGTIPTKPKDDCYTYTFSGWLPEISEVTADAVYTAQFERMPRTYEITLNSNGGEIAESLTSYIYGTAVTLPIPTKEGYTFNGWYNNEDCTGTAVSAISNTETGNKTYYAKWTKNEYLITFVNYDNSELQSGNIAVNTMPEYTGTTPTKPEDDCYTYTFRGWSPEILEVIADAVYTAQFERTPRTYTVILNSNGGEIAENLTSYTYGTAVTLPIPTKEEYTFNGWYDNEACSGTVVSAISNTETGNKAYYAKWTKNAPTEYLVTFVNYDNSKLQSENIAVNTLPEYRGTTPTKPEDDCYTYTFSGWSPELSEVTAAAVYTAQFESTPKTYTVLLNANGGEISENIINYTYGTAITLPIPTREGYSFGGWYDNKACSGTVVSAISNTSTGDKTYYAKWAKDAPTEYLITFVNYDNAELQSGNVAVNTLPEYNGTTPTKPEDDCYTYTFSGWSPELSVVTKDTVYKAQYEKTPKTYTVTLNTNNAELPEIIINHTYGVVTKLPTLNRNGYTFSGWYDNEAYSGMAISEIPKTATGDTTYYAKWAKIAPTECLVTFVNYDNAELQSKNVAANTIPEYNGATPIKPDDDCYTYTFSGWSPEVTAVVADATYVAQYKSIPQNYNVTFNVNGGELETDVTSYTYGIGFTLPTPTRDNYIFDGWYDNEDCSGVVVSEISNTATGDKIYYAKWTKEVPKEYLITFRNYDNSNLQSGYIANGEMPEYSGATPTRPEDKRYTYTFSGWSPEVSAATKNVTYTAQYKETPKTYNIMFKYEDGEISENLTSYTYGTFVILPTATREGYVFDGWYDNEYFTGNSIFTIYDTETGDKIYYAKWRKEYLITFVNYDNSELYSEKLPTGKIPYYNAATPTKPSDDKYSYIFSGWSPEIKAIDGDMTYMAHFKAISKDYKYNIEYQDGKAYVTVPKAGEYSVIFAVYSENTLLRAEVKKVKFEDAGTKTVSPLESVDAKYKVKVMLWDSITGMQPLCPSAGNNL